MNCSKCKEIIVNRGFKLKEGSIINFPNWLMHVGQVWCGNCADKYMEDLTFPFASMVIVSVED
jgi:hypothetical protein